MDRLRDAVSIFTDIDSHLLDEIKNITSEQKIVEHINRERELQQKSGWLDSTEVLVRFNLSSHLPFIHSLRAGVLI